MAPVALSWIVDNRHSALLELGRRIQASGYRFVTPTPETHRRVLERPHCNGAYSLPDIFGWNKPFPPSAIPEAMYELLQAAGCAIPCGGGLVRSQVRYSSLGSQLFAHSGFPTEGADAVFFGPDTYRFARAISEVSRCDPQFKPRTLIDVGTGSGAGGLFCAALYPKASIVLADINPSALQFARINAALNHVPKVDFIESDVLASFAGSADFIIANPPYLIDVSQRTYRHGGGPWGYDLARRIVAECVPRLRPKGRLLLYTGSPVVEGVDKFFEAVEPILRREAVAFHYGEIDPDVFGEELSNAPYDHADRIAIVVLIVKARSPYNDTY